MKLIVFFLIVGTNISDNGKASLDSFVPMSTNILLEDTTKNAGNVYFTFLVSYLYLTKWKFLKENVLVKQLFISWPFPSVG